MEKRLVDMLRGYTCSDSLPMHMPGHKRNPKFDWLVPLGEALDITEIYGFDDLNDPEGIFQNLGRLAADTCGSELAIPMVNGSTGGILAAVKAALPHREAMLIARNCHKAVYNAGELFADDIEFAMPAFSDRWGICGSITPEQVKNALEEHGDIKLVAITSPTYEGIISDIGAISEVCHRYGAVLLVDQAHGAHLGFGGFPERATKLGADIVVESLHKTLPSLTQTALLHLSGNLVDPSELKRCAAIFQSSSPSYLLSASVDGCVRFLTEHGDAEADSWLKNLRDFYEAAESLTRLKVMNPEEPDAAFFKHDPSKILISCADADISGPELMERLRDELKIELEMASAEYVLAMTGMGDTKESLRRLFTALTSIDRGLKPPSRVRGVFSLCLPERDMPINEALIKDKIDVPMSAAAGRTAGEYVWTYPPGIPMIVPGEKVDERMLQLFSNLRCDGVILRSTSGKVPQFLRCLDNSKSF